ncbi:outer membrane protein assembly factor BamD [Candidatus Pelagibacter sp.]|nr:outer membrane protein assembly factor BamD [Candidatus Pelagibacter sp.]
MSKYKIKLLLISLIIITACSSDTQTVKLIKETNQKEEMISNYKAGVELLEIGDYFAASKKFLEAEILFPQSRWAPKSVLMASYSYFLQGYYTLSIDNIKRYLKTYPKDKNKPYAHYLLAMCYYETIEGEKKDLAPLILSKKELNFIIKNYPNTDFAYDARFKIDLINDTLAAKEVYLGRHYIKKKKWIPALNRFKNVLNEYETTVHVEEAIHRLVEIYYKLGMEQESLKYASLLGYNYNSGEWYKETYRIFNKKYKVSVPKNKKQKSKILSKIKNLF